MRLTPREKFRKRYRRWLRIQEKNFRGRHDYIDRVLQARAMGCVPLAVPVVFDRGVSIGFRLPSLDELRAETREQEFWAKAPPLVAYSMGDGPIRFFPVPQ